MGIEPRASCVLSMGGVLLGNILDITFFKITLVCLCAACVVCLCTCMCVLVLEWVHVYAYLPVCMYTQHMWKLEDNCRSYFSSYYESLGMNLGPQARQQAHLEAPSLFSDSFSSSDFPGGTQGLMSFYCMPLMTHLCHVLTLGSYMGPQHGKMG